MYHSGINMPIEKFVFEEDKPIKEDISLLSLFEEMAYEKEIEEFYPVMTKKALLEK